MLTRGVRSVPSGCLLAALTKMRAPAFSSLTSPGVYTTIGMPGGTAPGTQFSQLSATAATLAGTLTATLVGGFTLNPATPYQFSFLTSGSHTGTFGTLNMPVSNNTIRSPVFRMSTFCSRIVSFVSRKLSVNCLLVSSAVSPM